MRSFSFHPNQHNAELIELLTDKINKGRSFRSRKYSFKIQCCGETFGSIQGAKRSREIGIDSNSTGYKFVSID